MKKALSYAALSLLTFVPIAYAQDVTCESLSEGDFQTAVSSGVYECAVNPDLVEIKVYEIALCTSLPSVSDQSSCEIVFSSPNGRPVSISSGSSTSLAGVFELSYDSFPYVYAVVDNEISFKATFNPPSEVGVMSQDLAGSVSGNYGSTCWTNGNDAKQDHTNQTQPINVDCGATSNAQLSTETFRSFTDAMSASVTGIPGVGGDTFDAYLISASGDLASIESAGDILTSSNADKIAFIQHSASPLVVTENTTNIDLGFATTNRMNVMFLPCVVNSSNDECAAYSFTTGLQIHATAQ